MGTSISSIKLPLLSVCDLGRTGVRNALKVDITALMSYDLSVPQAWGLAFQQHSANFMGIKFNSRFTNRPCIALFDRNNLKGSLNEKRIGALTGFDEALEWLEKFEVQLI